MKLIALGAALGLAACGPMPFAKGIDMAKVPPAEAQAALAVRVFDQTTPQPAGVRRIVGEVQATSCKNKVWDPPAATGNALAQLRLKALRMGANAVTGVTYDTRGTDALGTNCWQSVTASGIAVEL